MAGYGTVASRQSTLYPAHNFGEVRHLRCSLKRSKPFPDIWLADFIPAEANE